MMEYWISFLEFSDKSPVTSVVLAVVALSLVSFLVERSLKLVNQFMRVFIIMIRGYPPPHCDVDGDCCCPDECDSEDSVGDSVGDSVEESVEESIKKE